MAETTDHSIDHYFANLKNPRHHDDLQRLRAFVQQQFPDASEDLTYSMPTYSQAGQVVVAFASQRSYMSLYLDVDLVEQHRADLSDLDCGKSCIRFKKLDALPLDVIGTIIQETVARQRSAE